MNPEAITCEDAPAITRVTGSQGSVGPTAAAALNVAMAHEMSPDVEMVHVTFFAAAVVSIRYASATPILAPPTACAWSITVNPRSGVNVSGVAFDATAAISNCPFVDGVTLPVACVVPAFVNAPFSTSYGDARLPAKAAIAIDEYVPDPLKVNVWAASVAGAWQYQIVMRDVDPAAGVRVV